MLAHRTGNKLLALLLLIPLAVTGLVLGVFFFAVGLAVVTGFLAVLSLRLWWLRRKLRQQGAAPIIEGEFHTISSDHRLRRSDRVP